MTLDTVDDIARKRESRAEEYRAGWNRWRSVLPWVNKEWADVERYTRSCVVEIVDPLLDRIDGFKSACEVTTEELIGFEISVTHAAGFTEPVPRETLLQSIAANAADVALDEEHARLRSSIAQGLDCDPDDIEDRAREVTASLDRWYDFREELASLLVCEEAPGAIVENITTTTAQLTRERQARETSETAMVALAREVERLQRKVDRLSGRAPRRSLFARLAGVLQ